MPPRLLLPLACTTLLLLLLATRGVHAARECSNATAAVRGNTTHVAILFWGPPSGPLSGRLLWPRSPLLDGWNGSNALENAALQSYLLWEERMQMQPRAAYNGSDAAAELGQPGLRMLDGGVMRFNVTYFNVGLASALVDEDEFAPAYQNSTQNALIQQLADANGQYGRFHFIVTPLNSNTAISLLASLACETSETCMTIGPGSPKARQVTCAPPGVPLQRDCIARGRRASQRRFEFTVYSGSASDYWGRSVLGLAVNRQVQRVFVLWEDWAGGVLTQLQSTAQQLGIVVADSQVMARFQSDWSVVNTTQADIDLRIRSSQADLVLIVGNNPAPSLVQLLAAWRSSDFTPHAVGYVAQGHVNMPLELRSYMLIESVWLPKTTGPDFRAVCSPTNFETFSANATHDSPAVFAQGYIDRFSDPHDLVVFALAARAFHSITIAQKLVEMAQTDDVESLRESSLRIAVPAVFHAVQFDQSGRSLPSDNSVMQVMPAGDARIITPLGLGQAAVIPMPRWDERIFVPQVYASAAERVMLAATGVAMAYVFALAAWGVRWADHAVMRAASPIFCTISMAGLLALLVNNFLFSDATVTAACYASYWIFHLGLTVAFGSLLLKNLRIWYVWHHRHVSFASAKVTETHLGLGLLALVAIDVFLCSVHFAGDLRAARVVVDSDRPSHDYMICSRDRLALAVLYASVASKLVLFSSGMVLAWHLRSVASQFSEAHYIALCIYNAVVALAIMLPTANFNLIDDVFAASLVHGWITIYLAVSCATIIVAPKYMEIRAQLATQIARLDAAARAEEAASLMPSLSSSTLHTQAPTPAAPAVAAGTKPASPVSPMGALSPGPMHLFGDGAMHASVSAAGGLPDLRPFSPPQPEISPDGGVHASDKKESSRSSGVHGASDIEMVVQNTSGRGSIYRTRTSHEEEAEADQQLSANSLLTKLRIQTMQREYAAMMHPVIRAPTAVPTPVAAPSAAVLSAATRQRIAALLADVEGDELLAAEASLTKRLAGLRRRTVTAGADGDSARNSPRITAGSNLGAPLAVARKMSAVAILSAHVTPSLPAPTLSPSTAPAAPPLALLPAAVLSASPQQPQRHVIVHADVVSGETGSDRRRRSDHSDLTSQGDAAHQELSHELDVGLPTTSEGSEHTG